MNLYHLIAILLFSTGYAFGTQPSTSPKSGVKRPCKMLGAIFQEGADSKNAQDEATGVTKSDSSFDLSSVLPLYDIQVLIADYLPKKWRTIDVPLLMRNNVAIIPYKVAIVQDNDGKDCLLIGDQENEDSNVSLYDLNFTGNQVQVQLRRHWQMGPSAIEKLAQRGNHLVVYKKTRNVVLDRNFKHTRDEAPVYNGQEITVNGDRQQEIVVSTKRDQEILRLSQGDTRKLISSVYASFLSVATVELSGKPYVAVGMCEMIRFYNPSLLLAERDMELKRGQKRSIKLDDESAFNRDLMDHSPIYLAGFMHNRVPKLIVGRGRIGGPIANICVLDVESKRFENMHRFERVEQVPEEREPAHKAVLFAGQDGNHRVALLLRNGDLKIWNPYRSSAPNEPYVIGDNVSSQPMRDFIDGDIAAGKTPQGYPFIFKVAKDGYSDEYSHTQVVIQDKPSVAEQYLRGLRANDNKKRKLDDVSSASSASRSSLSAAPGFAVASSTNAQASSSLATALLAAHRMGCSSTSQS